MLRINEIFYSIQGESSHAGRPCVFVRLAGCDLRCTWCDTPYAFGAGRAASVEDVEAAVDRYACPLVEITGGEPLLQDDVYPLMVRLLASGRTVMLETGGHVDLSRVPASVITIMDVKCPSSGEAHRTDLANLDRLAPHDEVKFVVGDRADYEYARGIIRAHGLARRGAGVLVSPVHGGLDPAVLSSWMLEDGLPGRLQLQLHKYVWGSTARGV